MYLKRYTTLVLIFLYGFQIIETVQILALFINGHRSHLLAYSSVINLLTQRGHNVTIVTTLDIKDIGLNTENIRWLKLSDTYTKTEITSNRYGLSKIENMLERIEDTSKFMDDPMWLKFMQESHQYDLMILGYLFNDYQLGLAAHFNCSVVTMWTGQPIGFIHSLMGNPEERRYVPQPYDRHQYKGIQAIAFGWFEKFIEFLALNKMKDIYKLVFKTIVLTVAVNIILFLSFNCSKHFWGPQYPSFKEIRKSVSVALCHHHSLSEGPIAPYLPTLIEIGGLGASTPVENHNEFILAKDSKNSDIIYFSFGSRVKWSFLPISLELQFIEAFKAFPDFTIIWTYDKNCTELALQFSASNIKCKSWWPQSSILASNQTKLFITHGGKGSISEAQRNGKPILGIPFFGDQRANVAKIENRKLGLKLPIESVTVDSLKTAIRELLDNHIYGSNAEHFSRLYRDRPISSEDSAIYWLEYVIRHNGAKHLRSTALDLNIMEYYLIDVYFLIILSFSVIVVFCNWLEKILKRKISA